jgi:hypothetical protein
VCAVVHSAKIRKFSEMVTLKKIFVVGGTLITVNVPSIGVNLFAGVSAFPTLLLTLFKRCLRLFWECLTLCLVMLY